MDAPVLTLSQNRQAPQALAVSAAAVGGASQFCRYICTEERLSRRFALGVELVCRPGFGCRRPPAGRRAPAWAQWALWPLGDRGPRVTRGPPVTPSGSVGPWPPLGPLGPHVVRPPFKHLRRHGAVVWKRRSLRSLKTVRPLGHSLSRRRPSVGPHSFAGTSTMDSAFLGVLRWWSN